MAADQSEGIELDLSSAPEDRFWAIRGNAIQAYAILEQSLCMLFANLAGMENAIAGIIFFRITSTQVRNTIIEKLFSRKFGSEFNLFRNSLIVQIRPIDINRNEVVHWNVASNVLIEDDNKVTVTLSLIPPNFWDRSDHSPSKSTEDLLAFIHKCDFYSRLINSFYVMMITHDTSVHYFGAEAANMARYISETKSLSASRGSSVIPEAASTLKPASIIAGVTSISSVELVSFSCSIPRHPSYRGEG